MERERERRERDREREGWREREKGGRDRERGGRREEERWRGVFIKTFRMSFQEAEEGVCHADRQSSQVSIYLTEMLRPTLF